MQVRMNSRIMAFAVFAAIAMSFCLSVVASADSAQLFTVVGGASGMTLNLNPYKSLVRGCASKMMDVALKNERTNPDTGIVRKVYCTARIKANDPQWSEPNADGSWGAGQVKFTGDKKECEILYCKKENGVINYAIIIRADSVLGMRYVVNKQYIYDFSKCSGSTDTWTYTLYDEYTNGNKVNATTDADFNVVKAHMEAQLPKNGGSGIPIQGGLTEAYLDSGIDAIDKYNTMFPAPAGGVTQPQLNPANFSTTKDHILAVAVMAIIYNDYVQASWNGDQPINFTNQMIRMIEGGMIDTWDYFLSNCNEPNPDHKRIFNYYREPLSGTGISFLGLCMRGVETTPNGSKATEYYDFATDTWKTAASASDGVNYHRSGIPGLTCIDVPTTDPTKAAPDANPGGGRVNNAVNNFYGGIGYTFLQKFTNDDSTYSSSLQRIRVAKVNGYEPYLWEKEGGWSGEDDLNCLPGVNGNLDVTYTRPDGKSFFQNVIDGKYPLWTYNHCYAREDAVGPNKPLTKWINLFTDVAHEQKVRDVGLIAINDMETYANYRSMPESTSPNAGRGKGLGRCGFLSPRTGEIVRDGGMMLPLDKNSSHEKNLPGESYPEMRP